MFDMFVFYMINKKYKLPEEYMTLPGALPQSIIELEQVVGNENLSNSNLPEWARAIFKRFGGDLNPEIFNKVRLSYEKDYSFPQNFPSSIIDL